MYHIHTHHHALDCLLDPIEVAKKEKWWYKSWSPLTIPLYVDQPLTKVPTTSLEHVFMQRDFNHTEKYYLTILNHKVWLWFDQQAQSIDLIRGCYHAALLRYRLQQEEIHHESICIRQTHSIMTETVEEICNRLKILGWDVSHVFIGQPSHRLVVQHQVE
jgi:hypothetical protein